MTHSHTTAYRELQIADALLATFTTDETNEEPMTVRHNKTGSVGIVVDCLRADGGWEVLIDRPCDYHNQGDRVVFCPHSLTVL